MFKLCLEKKIHPLPFLGGCRGARRGIYRGKIRAFTGIRISHFLSFETFWTDTYNFLMESTRTHTLNLWGGVREDKSPPGGI